MTLILAVSRILKHTTTLGMNLSSDNFYPPAGLISACLISQAVSVCCCLAVGSWRREHDFPSSKKGEALLLESQHVPSKVLWSSSELRCSCGGCNAGQLNKPTSQTENILLPHRYFSIFCSFYFFPPLKLSQ